MLTGLGNDLLPFPHEPLTRHVEGLELRAVEAQRVVPRLPQPREALVKRPLLIRSEAKEFPAAAVEYKAKCGRPSGLARSIGPRASC